YVLTTSGGLNIREKPVDGKVITKLSAGDKVKILGDAPDGNYGWKKVKTSDGKTGFVSEEYLGIFSPEVISKGKLLGSVGGGQSPEDNNKSIFRIFGANLGGK